MRDVMLHVGFEVHVELKDGEIYGEHDAKMLVDRIQREVEKDPRCKVLIARQGGGLIHRLLDKELF